MKIIYLWIITLVLLSNFSYGQTQWTKYQNNPVLTKGPSNNDIIAIGQPTCLFENDTIKMWYAGVGADMKARIFYATSPDGINWTKYNNGTPVLDVGNTGEWDCGWLDTPEIVKGPKGYLLYYYGDTTQQSPEISSAYGAATSPDGINWTKYQGNPIFKKDTSIDWEAKWVESPAVLYDSLTSTYQMWYNGVAKNWLIKIGYATSTDGFNWTRYSGNPVFSVGSGGSFDDMWLGTPAIIHRNNLFELWYSGFSSISGFDTIRVGYATSPDGINWMKYSGNPLFDTYSPPYDSLIDKGGPWAPDVVYIPSSDIYKMFYEAEGGFSLAASPNTTNVNAVKILPDDEIIIYPYPASSNFTITTFINFHKANLKIFNVLGEAVLIKENLDGNEFQFELKNFPAGIYFISLSDKDKTLSKSIFFSN